MRHCGDKFGSAMGIEVLHIVEQLAELLDRLFVFCGVALLPLFYNVFREAGDLLMGVSAFHTKIQILLRTVLMTVLRLCSSHSISKLRFVSYVHMKMIRAARKTLSKSGCYNNVSLGTNQVLDCTDL